MKHPAILALALSGTTLSACHGRAENSEGQTVKIPVEELSPAIEETPAPPATLEGSVWTHAESARAAWFGPPQGPALLSISCEDWAGPRPMLAIVRHAPADPGAKALFAFQSAKGILRLKVDAVRLTGGANEWRGTIPLDDPKVEVLRGGAMKATLPGAGMLELPAMGPAAEVIDRCAVGRYAEATPEPGEVAPASGPTLAPAPAETGRRIPGSG
jgi:hypothetical protein